MQSYTLQWSCLPMTMMQTQSSKINILTWNVRGLNDHRKLRKVLAYLTRWGIDIALLQETHLPLLNTMLQHRGLQGNIHVAGFVSHARGVITWVNPKSELKLEALDLDPEGRFAISRCSGRGLGLVLANIYGPNYDNPNFCVDLLGRMSRYGNRQTTQNWVSLPV